MNTDHTKANLILRITLAMMGVLFILSVLIYLQVRGMAEAEKGKIFDDRF